METYMLQSRVSVVTAGKILQLYVWGYFIIKKSFLLVCSLFNSFQPGVDRTGVIYVTPRGPMNGLGVTQIWSVTVGILNHQDSGGFNPVFSLLLLWLSLRIIGRGQDLTFAEIGKASLLPRREFQAILSRSGASHLCFLEKRSFIRIMSRVPVTWDWRSITGSGQGGCHPMSPSPQWRDLSVTFPKQRARNGNLKW